jgi:hypothetical protein
MYQTLDPWNKEIYIFFIYLYRNLGSKVTEVVEDGKLCNSGQVLRLTVDNLHKGLLHRR